MFKLLNLNGEFSACSFLQLLFLYDCILFPTVVFKISNLRAS